MSGTPFSAMATVVWSPKLISACPRTKLGRAAATGSPAAMSRLPRCSDERVYRARRRSRAGPEQTPDVQCQQAEARVHAALRTTGAAPPRSPCPRPAPDAAARGCWEPARRRPIPTPAGSDEPLPVSTSTSTTPANTGGTAQADTAASKTSGASCRTRTVRWALALRDAGTAQPLLANMGLSRDSTLGAHTTRTPGRSLPSSQLPSHPWPLHKPKSSEKN